MRQPHSSQSKVEFPLPGILNLWNEDKIVRDLDGNLEQRWECKENADGVGIQRNANEPLMRSAYHLISRFGCYIAMWVWVRLAAFQARRTRPIVHHVLVPS